MIRRASTLFVAALSLGVASCSDSSTPPAPDTLPQAPQIMPNAQEGVIGYPLSLQGEPVTIDGVFVNGGQDPLVISSATIVNDTHSVFTLTEPDSLTVESRKAIGFPITFTSPGRGVYIADFVVDSNAANLPEITLQLVAPGAGQIIPEYPDIQPFESTVEIQTVAGIGVPAALVRVYNLGGASLELASYTLADTTNFRFLEGTAIPGIDCSVSGACVTAAGGTQGCCGVLDCVPDAPPASQLVGVCSSVLVARGRFVVFGVTWTDAAASGTHSTSLTIVSNGPIVGQSIDTVVTIHGTK